MIAFFLVILTGATVGFTEKGSLFPEKCCFVAVICLLFKLKECKRLEAEHTHNLHVCIKFCNSKDSLENLKLNCSELNFSEKIMSKINTNETNL